MEGGNEVREANGITHSPIGEQNSDPQKTFEVANNHSGSRTKSATLNFIVLSKDKNRLRRTFCAGQSFFFFIRRTDVRDPV